MGRWREMTDFLCCPLCRAGLDVEETQISCSGCGACFAVAEGIPLLIPSKAERPCSACGSLVGRSEAMIWSKDQTICKACEERGNDGSR